MINFKFFAKMDSILKIKTFFKCIPITYNLIYSLV